MKKIVIALLIFVATVALLHAAKKMIASMAGIWEMMLSIMKFLW